jgi:GntR family transcriptional regulator/MocR family aminotransferase
MLWLPLDRTSNVPLIRQLYLELRQRILNGELPAQQRLPATRTLAMHLGVSRNVVLEAYDQLIAEGYLEGRSGSGTYVAQGAYWELAASQPPVNEQRSGSPELEAPDQIDFRSGIPALDRFPRKLWGQLAQQMCLEVPAVQFGYGSPEGEAELRANLAHYLLRTRGVNCQAEQIVITSGAAQAFALVVKLLAAPGETVVVEDPVPQEIRQIFLAGGALLQSIPVDDRGLQTHLLNSARDPRFVLVTPSHQFPLGSVLTIQRRIELLQFARATGSFIVEDDYDSEFRYEGTPVSSLQGLAPEQVIYVGTFSKILSPALRLGYLVLPFALVEECRRLKRLNDLHTSALEQLTLARFIQMGHLERHVARMKKLYRQRRNMLRRSLFEHFADQVKVSGDSTGLHLVAEFAEMQFSAELLQRTERQGVRIYPVSAYAIAPELYQQQIVLGYGNVAIAEIEIGIQRLQKSFFNP